MVSYIDMMVYYTRKTEKAYLLRMCSDGQEVWFPKKTVFNVNEGNTNVQTVKIADFMLEQKGYSNIGSVRDIMRENVENLPDKLFIDVSESKQEYMYVYCKQCWEEHIIPIDKMMGQLFKCERCGYDKYYISFEKLSVSEIENFKESISPKGRAI